MNKHLLRFICLCIALATIGVRAETKKPNLIFILTDNHGAWTLGCYGNKEIRTPNLDRLAAEGTLFTRAYCANPVCSPSRATFLTGLMPSQHGVHNFLGPDKASSPSGPEACVIHEFASLPKILSKAGYVCGLSGKWHLGGSFRPQEGFSHWFTKPGGHTTKFYGEEMIWNGKLYTETNYTTEAITDRAVEFLEQNRQKPFFLYVAYNAPYGLGAAVQNPHTNRHTAYYADKNMDSFPRAEIHPTLRANRAPMNNVAAMRNYAAAVSGMDDGVGRVMETLKRLKLDTNTLVVFSADQGLAGGHGGFWGIGDHSRPVNVREPVARIPMIFRRPAKVVSGVRSDLLVSNYDFLPTVLDHLGLERKLPEKPPLPGKSFDRTLAGKSQRWNNVIFHEYENTRMMRNDDWKFVMRFPSGPNELYDMRRDPDEQTNLIQEPKHRATVQKLQKQLEDFFKKYVDPKYDLWRDGISKANRAVKD